MVFKFEIGPETVLDGQAVEFWQSAFPNQPPGEIYRIIKKSLPFREEGELVRFTVFKPDLFDIDIMLIRDKKELAQFKFNFDTKEGRKLSTIRQPSVSEQGRGLMTNMVNNMRQLWEHFDIGTVSAWPSYINAYTMAKYGITPVSITMIAPHVAERLEKLRPQIGEEVYSSVLADLRSGQQQAIWSIADRETRVSEGGKTLKLGQALLIGSSYQGTINLKDETALSRLNGYLQSRSPGRN